jgi:hypothetical protein
VELLLFPEMMQKLLQKCLKVCRMLARMIQGMLPALAPIGTSSVSSSCLPLSSNLHADYDLPLLFFLTVLLSFLAMLMLFLLAMFLMTVLVYFPIKCSHLLSFFQVPSAVEKMVVLQSHLKDLFPPEKEEDDPDDVEDSKQLMADAPSLA